MVVVLNCILVQLTQRGRNVEFVLMKL